LLGLAINFASTYQTENPQEFTKWREQAITYSHLNIFSGKEEPFAPDYFKGLWSRFKKRSKLLEKDQTLYSFRHTGAIDVYKRTGSIEKLKAAMGHSNIMVSLTYLRGLDVAELKEEDMPIL
jgi:integrase